jgi:hypothetical protein
MLLTRLGVVALATTPVTRAAAAEPLPPSEKPVDVVITDVPAPHKTLLVEWNPLSLFLSRVSLNAVIAPIDHHALVVSPFYTWVGTEPYATGIDANGNNLVDTTGNVTGSQGSSYTLNVLRQTFKGFGTELGYRYYFDRGGPRGFFLGPSLILGWITATAGNGETTKYLDLGVAADVGYQAIIVDRVSIAVGAGVQYAFPSTSIPDQQMPAATVANAGFKPRMLFSLGYAFF